MSCDYHLCQARSDGLRLSPACRSPLHKDRADGADRRFFGCRSDFASSRHLQRSAAIDTVVATRFRRLSSHHGQSCEIMVSHATGRGVSSRPRRTKSGFSCLGRRRACWQSARHGWWSADSLAHDYRACWPGRSGAGHARLVRAVGGNSAHMRGRFRRAADAGPPHGSRSAAVGANGAGGCRHSPDFNLDRHDAAQRDVVVESPARCTGRTRPARSPRGGSCGLGFRGLHRHAGGLRFATRTRGPKTDTGNQDRRWTGGRRGGSAGWRRAHRGDQPVGG
ncbi:hypothetical protein M2323_000929 [Rhodoblastus acidophilus]|nr:hypothetical protein [Rhodoblastus acidophilus]MCW2332020.1 hypothetical protein [Rhodoblastus acidophilus]